MKYKIGDVARILGISTDLLRYYEKKGVVKPEKNAHNDYRYYDSWDINFLVDCLWFKNFGFSIEQIADMVKIPDISELDRLFVHKDDELRALIKRCELLLKRSQEYRDDLSKAKTLLYQCEIEESPRAIHFLNREGSEYALGAESEWAARRWLTAMPFNRRCFEIDRGDLRAAGQEECRWGFSLTMDYAAALDFPTVKPMTISEPHMSIHTVFKSSGGRNGFAPSLLGYALDFAETNGLRVSAPVHGVLLASIMEQGMLTGYFEAWLPVE